MKDFSNEYEWVKFQSAMLFPKVDANQVKNTWGQAYFSKIIKCNILGNITTKYLDLICLNNQEILSAFEDFMYEYACMLDPFMVSIIDELLERAANTWDQNKYGYLFILVLLVNNLSSNPILLATLLPKFANFFKEFLLLEDEESLEIILDCLTETIDTLEDVPNEFVELFPLILQTIYQKDTKLWIPSYGFNILPIIWELINKVLKMKPKCIFDYETNGKTTFDILKYSIHSVFSICNRQKLTKECMPIISVIDELLNCKEKSIESIPDFIHEIVNFMENPYLTILQKREIINWMNSFSDYDAELAFETIQKMGKNLILRIF